MFAQQNNTTYTTVEGKKTRESPFFTQFDLIIPLRANENRGKIYYNGSTDNDWFIPNGLSIAAGCGLQQKKWVALSAHASFDALLNQKLVAIPLYINFRLSPRIYEDTRLVFQTSLGQAFALGRGNLQGKYQKHSIGLETDEDLNIFIAIAGYDFNSSKLNTGYVGLGIAVRRF
jgi:hypothetical protein